MAKKRPIDIWDEQEARKAHGSRHPYTVLAGDPNFPECVAEVINDYIGVEFLDADLRVYLSYQFQELEPGRVFLTMATHRTFQENTSIVASGTTYFFKPNGIVDIEDQDFVTETISTRQTKADVSGNWDTYPVFGEYVSLLKAERT